MSLVAWAGIFLLASVVVTTNVIAHIALQHVWKMETEPNVEMSEHSCRRYLWLWCLTVCAYIAIAIFLGQYMPPGEASSVYWALLGAILVASILHPAIRIAAIDDALYQ